MLFLSFNFFKRKVTLTIKVKCHFSKRYHICINLEQIRRKPPHLKGKKYGVKIVKENKKKIGQKIYNCNTCKVKSTKILLFNRFFPNPTKSY